jgi:hypothetical protein
MPSIPDSLWSQIEASLREKLEPIQEDAWKQVWDSVGASGYLSGLENSGLALSLPTEEEVKNLDYSPSQKYFEDHGLEFIKNTTDTDISTIRNALEANWGDSDAFVEDLSPLYSEERLLAIYRSETHMAVNNSSIAAAKSAGIVTKTRRATGDERMCPICGEADGETVGINELFSDGSFDCHSHVNCRCVLLFDTSPVEKSGTSEGVRLSWLTRDHGKGGIEDNIRESYLGIKDSSKFDISQERSIIKSTIKTNRDFWSSSDPDAQYLRKRDGITENKVPDKLDYLIIFDNQSEYYGRGLSGKVWWNPYSLENRFENISESLQNDENMDPVFVLSHELHHSFGHENELDLTSTAAGYLSHLDLGMKYAGDGVKFGLSLLISHLYHDDNKQMQRDSAATLRLLIKRDEPTFRSFLISNKIVNDDSFDYMRYEDIKNKAMSVKIPRQVKHRDTSEISSALFRSGITKFGTSEGVERSWLIRDRGKGGKEDPTVRKPFYKMTLDEKPIEKGKKPAFDDYMRTILLQDEDEQT